MPDQDTNREDDGYAAQLRRYAEEFRGGFLYEVLRWGNDQLLHGGTFQRLVGRACAEFAREGPPGADAASLVFEELFRRADLDRLLGIPRDDKLIRLDPAALLRAFEERLADHAIADPRYFSRRRAANLVVAFLRTLERLLTTDSYLAERFNFEYGLFLDQLPPDRRPPPSPTQPSSPSDD
ncbi:MAG: hypothetical protein GF399_04970 [Candidatus Coatesbacteria bacterium]|nr:hypothetical protein [Candidatus Coatesbacteria bacterium]